MIYTLNREDKQQTYIHKTKKNKENMLSKQLLFCVLPKLLMLSLSRIVPNRTIGPTQPSSSFTSAGATTSVASHMTNCQNV